MLTGRGIAGGDLRGMSALDVAPLVLYLLALPLAADMPGEPPWHAIDPAYLKRHPPWRVPTHEVTRERPEFVEETPEIEAELVERLRALGYLE